MNAKPGVLILDDDQRLRKTLGDILAIKGFRPIPTELGKEAIAIASREDVAVALIDLRLEDMPGLDVLRTLHENSPSTECILLTGNASQDSAIEAVNLGAYSYFQKPFDVEQLILTIRRAVEKRAAARALAESEDRYHTFINATADMAFLKDADFRYLLVNEANAAFFGKPVEEVVGRDDFELMSTEAARACRASDEQVLHGKRMAVSVEEVGGRFYETRKFPVPLQDGGVGIGGYVRDITETLQAQQSLRESEERYRTVADNTHDWEYWVGPEGTWLYCSPSCERITGYPPEKFLEDPAFLLGLIHPEDREKVQDHNRVKTPVDLHEVQFRLLCKDGSLRWIGHICREIVTPDGKKLGRRGSNRDITESKQAELNLAEAESKLRAIVEQVPAIVYTESAGKKRNTLYISPQIEVLTGYTPSEWIADPDLWKNAIHPADRATVVAEDKRTTRSGEPFRVEYRIVTLDGRTLWVRDEAVLVRDEQGSPLFWQGIMHDITARKSAEEALQESQRRLSTLMSNLPGLAYRCKNDPFWTMEFVSGGCYPLTGYQSEDLVNNARLSYTDVIHPDDREMVWQVIEAQLEQQQPYQLNYRIITATGQEKWVWEQGQGVFSLSGELLALEGLITDITERKTAEESLRASEERYRMLAENMTDTIWLMDLSLKIIYISPSVTKLRGYTLDELNSIPLEEQMTPDSFQTAIKLFAETLSPENLVQNNQPITRTVELEFYKKYGTSVWSENTFTLIRNPDGTPRAILGSGRDISERKRAQQALENSEKRFRALIENSSDVITLLDPRGKILYNSPAYRDVMGYGPLDRIGKSAFELVHPEDQASVSQAFNEIIQHPGQSRSISFRTHHKDDSWRWVDVTASNMLGEPSIQGIVLNFRDITARKQAEQELRASEEKFRSVIQRSVDGIVLTDETGDIFEWNRGQEEITGLPASEALGKKVWDVQIDLAIPANKTPENRAYLRSAIEQSLVGGVSPLFGQPVENALQNLKTGQRFIQTLAFPIPTEKGFMICSISRDVTEKKQGEETLRRQLVELEVLYENGLAISRLLEPRQIASQMIEILSRKLDWHHAAIRLYHPDSNRVEALAISHPGVSVEELDQQLARLNSVITRPGKGMSGWVIKHGKPVRSGNVEADKRYLATYPNIHSGLYIPIQLGPHTIGSIAVESEQENAFTEQDERILTTLASQAAIAFENARLYQEAVREAERRAILHRAGQDVSAAGLDLETVYQTIERAASGLMPFDVFLISRYESGKDAAEVVYALDSGEHYSGYRVLLGQGITGRVIQNRRPLLEADYHQTQRSTSTAFGKGDARSILAVPMFAGPAIIGVISVQSYQPDLYKENDQTLLEILAAYAGPAIENARLFENERNQRQLAEALRDALGAGASLSESLDFDTITGRLLEALEKIIPYDGANIMLLDSQGKTASVARTHGYERYSKQAARRVASSSFELDSVENLRYMYETRQPLVIPDTGKYPGWIPEKDGDLIRSWAGAPIIVNDRVLAFFSVIKLEPDFYTEEHAEILRSFSGQAALALQNARLFEQTSRRAEELSALAEVSASLRTALTRAEMLPAVLDQVMRLLVASDAGLIAYDPLNKENIVELARGKWAKAIGKHFKQGEGLSGWMMHTHLPYQADNIQTESRWMLRDETVHAEAVVGVPLLVQGQFIGSLWVGRVRRKGDKEPVPFTANESTLLGSIADIAASALQRATLHEQAVRHAEQLITVNEIGHVLGETLELNQIYTRLTGSIYNLLPDIAGIFISLFDPKAQTITCACGHMDGAFLDVTTLPVLPFDPEGVGRQSHVLLTSEHLIANDLGAHPIKRSGGTQVGDPARFTQSALYVPMIAKGTPIGLIQVQSYTPNRFGQTETNLLSLVANTAAISIENARLFAETQKRVRNLSALHSIDVAISASVDLRVTLGILLEHTVSELKADAASILLLNPVTHILEYTASHGFYTHLIEGTRLNLGDGLAGQAALQRRLQSIVDLRNAPSDIRSRSIYEGEGFVSHHAIPLIAKGQVQGVLEVFHRSPLQPDDEWHNFFDLLSGQAAIAIDSARLFDDLQRSNLDLMLAYDATIQGWSQALELRDKETEGHAQRVTDLTVNLARCMGIPEMEMDHIRRGTLLHDIGKMGIPDAILLKPGKLTPEEWDVMKRHPVYAYDMLSSIAYLRPALAIPHYHHEKWDGSGYPDGLKGEQIPLPARLFAIVDVYDALTNDRPYRPAWSREKTLEYIHSESGKQFDPKVVEAFERLLSE